MTTETSPQTTADAATPLERARALRPLIESLRDEMEEQRRMPQALVDAMHEAQLFRMYVPKSIGGLEMDPATPLRVIEEIARVDGSAGWNLMIGLDGGLFAGFIPEHVAREIYGPANAVVAGTVAPTGRAVPEGNGYRVTGRWSFGSGIHHATWAGAGCFIYEGAAPRIVDGAPQMRLAMAPASDIEIHDVWRVSGLRGTGSEDFSMHDLFVPEEYTFRMFEERFNEGRLYHMPIELFSAAIVAVPLGIARGAIDGLVELTTNKVPMRFGSLSKLSEKPRAQISVAQAEALLGSARAYFYEAIEEMWETVQAGDPATMEQRVKLRLASLQAVQASAQAVDLMYNTGGGTSVYDRSPLSRCFRDVHATTQHAAVAAEGFEDAGRVLLGVPTNSVYFRE
jgi:alkylation response protein AidB-like acyl-CoA dehydrogenase